MEDMSHFLLWADYDPSQSHLEGLLINSVPNIRPLTGPWSTSSTHSVNLNAYFWSASLVASLLCQEYLPGSECCTYFSLTQHSDLSHGFEISSALNSCWWLTSGKLSITGLTVFPWNLYIKVQIHNKSKSDSIWKLNLWAGHHVLKRSYGLF